MNTEKAIQEAIEIGKRNAKVITLVTNWCANAHVEQPPFAGVGIVEQMYGLPVGIRGVRCPHARAQGIAGMDLGVVALDFHDRNCVGCQHRVPVGLPNLSELVGKRDQARAQEKEAERVSEDMVAAEIACRRATRAALRNSDPIRSGVLDLIDEFDRDPGNRQVTALLESVKAVGRAFDNDVQCALYDIIEGHGVRASGALEVLNKVATDRGHLVAEALKALAAGKSTGIAATIVEQDLSPAQAHLVEAAVPALVSLIRYPMPDYPGMDWERMARAGPLVAAHKAAPAEVEIGLRRQLRDAYKEVRRSAALAALDVVRVAPEAALRLLGDLIAAFSLTDDGYDSGEASTTIADVIAQSFCLRPEQIDDALQKALPHVDSAGQLGITRSYLSVFPRGGSKERALTSTQAESLAFDRILEVFARLPNNSDLVRELADFFSPYRNIPWDLLAKGAPTLIGAAAVATDETAQDDNTEPIVLEPERHFLRQLERENRRSDRGLLCSAALCAVQTVAQGHPDAAVRLHAIDLVAKVLSSIPASAEQFKAELVGALGRLGHSPRHVARVVPLIYRALTDQAQRVRAAAVAAYADLAESVGVSGLPELLSQLVVAMLSDPYVIVHARALEAVKDVQLPDALRAEALNRVLTLVRVHLDDRNSRTAPLAIRVFFRLLGHEKRSFTPRQLSTFLGWIVRLAPNAAADLLFGYSYLLRNAPGYGEAILSLMASPEPRDTSRKNLLKLLEELPFDSVQRLEKRIGDLAVNNPQDYSAAIRCFWLLTRHAQWSSARRVVCALVDSLDDTTENLPQRLRLKVLVTAVELEAAAAAEQTDVVEKKAAEIRALQAEIKSDDERNADVRGILPPVFRTPFGG